MAGENRRKLDEVLARARPAPPADPFAALAPDRGFARPGQTPGARIDPLAPFAPTRAPGFGVPSTDAMRRAGPAPLPRFEDLDALQREEEQRRALERGNQAADEFSPLPAEAGWLDLAAGAVTSLGRTAYDTVNGEVFGDQASRTRNDNRDEYLDRAFGQLDYDVLNDEGVIERIIAANQEADAAYQTEHGRKRSPFEALGDAATMLWRGPSDFARQSRRDYSVADAQEERSRIEDRYSDRADADDRARRAAADDLVTTASGAIEFIPGVGLIDLAAPAARSLGRTGFRAAGAEIPEMLAPRPAHADFDGDPLGPLTTSYREGAPLREAGDAARQFVENTPGLREAARYGGDWMLGTWQGRAAAVPPTAAAAWALSDEEEVDDRLADIAAPTAAAYFGSGLAGGLLRTAPRAIDDLKAVRARRAAGAQPIDAEFTDITPPAQPFGDDVPMVEPRAPSLPVGDDVLANLAPAPGEAGRVRRINLPEPFMGSADVILNPTRADIEGILARQSGDTQSVRWGTNADGEVYAWDGLAATHGMVEGGTNGRFLTHGEIEDPLEIDAALSTANRGGGRRMYEPEELAEGLGISPETARRLPGAPVMAFDFGEVQPQGLRTLRTPEARADWASDAVVHMPADSSAAYDIYGFRGPQDSRFAVKIKDVVDNDTGPFTLVSFEDMTRPNLYEPHQAQGDRFSATETRQILNRVIAAIEEDARVNQRQVYSILPSSQKHQQVYDAIARTMTPPPGYRVVGSDVVGEIRVVREGAANPQAPRARRANEADTTADAIDRMPLLDVLAPVAGAGVAGAGAGALLAPDEAQADDGSDNQSGMDPLYPILGGLSAATLAAMARGRPVAQGLDSVVGANGGHPTRRIPGSNQTGESGLDSVNAGPQRAATEPGTETQRGALRGRDTFRGSEAFEDSRLSPQQNQVVAMARNNYANAEIARALGMTNNQVSVILNAARSRAPDVEIAHALAPKRTRDGVDEALRLHDEMEAAGLSNQRGAEGGTINQRIAAQLGLSQDGVKSRLYHARRERGDPLPARGRAGERGEDGFHDPRLSPQENKAVEMARNNYPNHEIAEELDVSIEHARVLLSRARTKGVEVDRGARQRDGLGDRILALHDELKAAGYTNAPGAGGGTINQMIAQRLGIDLNKVKVRLHLARRSRKNDPLASIALGATGAGAAGAWMLGDEADAQEVGAELSDGREIQDLPGGIDFRDGEFLEPWGTAHLDDGSEVLMRGIVLPDGRTYNLVAVQGPDASIDVVGFVDALDGIPGAPAPVIGEGGTTNPPTDWSLYPTARAPALETDDELDPLARIGLALGGGALARSAIPRRAPLVRDIAAAGAAAGTDIVTRGGEVEDWADPAWMAGLSAAGSRFATEVGPHVGGHLAQRDAALTRREAASGVARSPEFAARRDAFALTLPDQAPNVRTLSIEADPFDHYAYKNTENGLVPAREALEQGLFEDVPSANVSSPRQQFLDADPVDQVVWMEEAGEVIERAPQQGALAELPLVGRMRPLTESGPSDWGDVTIQHAYEGPTDPARVERGIAARDRVRNAGASRDPLAPVANAPALPPPALAIEAPAEAAPSSRPRRGKGEHAVSASARLARVLVHELQQSVPDGIETIAQLKRYVRTQLKEAGLTPQEIEAALQKHGAKLAALITAGGASAAATHDSDPLNGL